ncbi:MAG: OmpW family outer membrane protein [Ferruginibacter sp.]
MKKFLFATAIMIFAATAVSAQDSEGGAYSKGQSTVAIGYGFISPYKNLFKFTNLFAGPGESSKYSSIGPVGLTYEYGISDKISMGLQVAYGQNKNVSTEKDGISAGKDYIVTSKLTQISAILRGNYHFGSSSKFDPYVGLGLGYGNFKYETTSNDPADNNDPFFDSFYNISVPTSFGITGQVGAKYYFSSNIGMYAELGYLAGSFAQVGINFKF